MSIRVIKAAEAERLLAAEAELESARSEAARIIQDARGQAEIIVNDAHGSASQIRTKAFDDASTSLETRFASAQMEWISEQCGQIKLAEAESLLAFESLVFETVRVILPGLEPTELVAGVLPHMSASLRRGDNATIEVCALQLDRLGADARLMLEAAGMNVEVTAAPANSPPDTLLVRLSTGTFDLTPSRQIRKIRERWSTIATAASSGT
jgi:vacuolar-type H+-ATPase subunit H